ncbi:DEAD/DEAH box helicase [Falsibacillus albus]|uniref:Helicase SNF n=1 Tax=Falsibacillus albus TaxID=2478915 RepID=A0A3L7JVU3_9BACI|nr:DEAD/DEAH box helicase [Falsibacillus albus]RLQ94843.1 helicase SNF [Falsibacillus albus]
MDIKLSIKTIKEMCGEVSFKRGEAFYRANKVTINEYTNDFCEATVAGTEDFHVSVKKEANSGFAATCSCPSLASFDRDCQHIAAVLLAIYYLQKKSPISAEIAHGRDHNADDHLAQGLLTLFDDKQKRTSGEQLHFEDRQILEVGFTCQLQTAEKLIGIGMNMEGFPIKDIRELLRSVQTLEPMRISETFTYNPSRHCFKNIDNEIIQQLISALEDEKARNEHTRYKESLLTLSPSYWEELLPLLEQAQTSLVYAGEQFDPLEISPETHSLRFEFSKGNGKSYKLHVYGLTRLIVLKSYNTALYEGKVYQLKVDDCQRLSYLAKLTAQAGTNAIPISQEQVGFFMEKVIPGLKKFGRVDIAPDIAEQLKKTPLMAKLYLDRVNNRLLAGLEFHYENLVINPLENRELPTKSLIIRDVEKEDEILSLMDEFFGKTDGGYFLHNEEIEYEFLTYIVPKLQKMAQIYATTAVRNRIFRGNAKPRIRVKAQKDRINWLEFKFEMDGFAENDVRELLQALEEKRKYYRLPNGSLFSLETKEIQELNRFLSTVPEQIQDLSDGIEFPLSRGLQLLDTADESEIFNFEESFRDFLKTIRNPGILELPVPDSLSAILRDYQIKGFNWMKTLAYYGFGGILADDMGLGKTIQGIAFLLSELGGIRAGKKPALIVCPSSLTYNWLSELTHFAPEIETIVIDGAKQERVKLQRDLSNVDVVITSYPLLRSDVKWYEKQSFHTVFFDEAQAFKNPGTQTARAVKQLKADYRFALTGTPIENSSEELWSIFHVVFPELFQGLKNYSNLSRKSIAKRIGPFLLRRLKEDVLAELPEKVESADSVELLPEQKKLYTAYLAKLRHDTLKHLDRDTLRKNKIKILAGLTRLRQICCHPALFVDGYTGTSGKFLHLMQIIDESKHAGRRVLIFSQFTKMLGLIGRELNGQGQDYFYLDGQTPSADRVERCNRFNAGERDLFLISMKAGGTGLNLTGADTVILYDTWWNPAVEEQAADRAHRMGQTNAVQVIKLVARGTIEEKMNELQDKKRDMIQEIIEQDGSFSSLTEDDIREILMV